MGANAGFNTDGSLPPAEAVEQFAIIWAITTCDIGTTFNLTSLVHAIHLIVEA